MSKKEKSYCFQRYLESITIFPVKKFANLPNDLLSLFLSFFTLNDVTKSVLDHSCNSLTCFLCEVKNFLVSFQTGKGLQDSSLILSKLDYLETFTGKLAGFVEELYKSEQNCVGDNCNCCVSENFLQFFVETSCQCGFFAGRPAGIKGKIIEIPIAELIYPESLEKELYVSSNLPKLRARELIHLGKSSVLLKINENFTDCLKQILKRQDEPPELCYDPSCPKSIEIIIGQKKNANSLIVSLNYESVDKTIFNLAQVLSQLKNHLPLNLLTKDSTESFNISTIIFTKSKIHTVYTVYTLKDCRWFELKQLSYTLIGKGLWADVVIHALKKKLFPMTIFYTKTPAIKSKLSTFQLIIIEALSYSIDFFNSSTEFQNLIRNVNTFYNDRLESIENCLFCGIKRKILETCVKCGFFESDWNCNTCQAYNFSENKVCCYCGLVRINIGTDFMCTKCGRESYGSIDCIYCPLFECKKCKNMKSPFTSNFCRSCNKLTKGYSNCVESHNVWCFVCYDNAN